MDRDLEDLRTLEESGVARRLNASTLRDMDTKENAIVLSHHVWSHIVGDAAQPFIGAWSGTIRLSGLPESM